MKRQWMVIMALVLVLIIAAFAVMNTDPVPVNFAFTIVSWPLIMVILGSLFIGVLIAALLSMSSLFKERKEVKQLKQELAAADTKKQEAIVQVQKEHEKELSDKNKEIQHLKNELYQANPKP